MASPTRGQCFHLRLRRAHHDPVGRRIDGHQVPGLDVRLVEAREEAMGLEGLEVGVDVLGPILGVHEPVEAVTRAVVCVSVLDPDLDPAR